MKRWTYLAAAFLTALWMTGCGAREEAPEKKTERTEEEMPSETMEIPNPMEEVDGPEDLAAVGVSMEVPEEGENPSFYLINGVVGQISFTVGDVEYTFRGSAAAEDFSGIFEEFLPDEILIKDLGTEGDLRIRTTVSQGMLADWKVNQASYTLYGAAPAEEEQMQALCEELIKKQCSGEFHSNEK